MAQGFSCKCPERQKPVNERNWVIRQYRWNSGAFTSGNGERSDYSTVECLECGCTGRTKADYVYSLPQGITLVQAKEGVK
jgi:hypothetical protein